MTVFYDVTIPVRVIRQVRRSGQCTVLERDRNIPVACTIHRQRMGMNGSLGLRIRGPGTPLFLSRSIDPSAIMTHRRYLPVTSQTTILVEGVEFFAVKERKKKKFTQNIVWSINQNWGKCTTGVVNSFEVVSLWHPKVHLISHTVTVSDKPTIISYWSRYQILYRERYIQFSKSHASKILHYT